MNNHLQPLPSLVDVLWSLWLICMDPTSKSCYNYHYHYYEYLYCS